LFYKQWQAQEVPDEDYSIPQYGHSKSNESPSMPGDFPPKDKIPVDSLTQAPKQILEKVPTQSPERIPEQDPVPQPTPILQPPVFDYPQRDLYQPMEDPAPQTPVKQLQNAKLTSALPQSPVTDNLSQHKQSATERKQIGFNLLKEWDESQRHDLLFIKNLADTIFQRLEAAMK
jgi:hypothetical protein